MGSYWWIIAPLFFLAPFSLCSTVIPDPVPCFIALETRFFKEEIVNQALSLYDIRQELWLPMNALLQRKSGEVPERMKKETAFMVPNPIEYPMNRVVTAKILKGVLFNVFNEVILEYQPQKSAQSKIIFEYIFSRQISDFIKCFGPETIELRDNDLL